MNGVSRWLGFGMVPGTDEEAHRFLERRLTILLGLMFALWGYACVDNTIDVLLVQRRGLAEALGGRLAVMQFAGASLLGALWWLTRRGGRSRAFLHVADAGGALVQAALLGAILFTLPIAERPEFGPTLGLTHVLILRAAFIPSAPWRTAAVTATCWSLFTAAVGARYARPGELPAGSSARVVWLLVVWGVFAVVAATLITRIIYGLAERARAAMRLGAYTLDARLGEGATGIVYRARHAMLKRPTAVKLLRPERAGAVALARFEREVQLTASLSHPNVIGVYDYGRTPDGVFYYVMEYVEGLDLDTLVRGDGPQPAARVASILRQAAEGLGEAHAAGLIHRDVKPANLMVARRATGERVKVLDFGLVTPNGGEGGVARADLLVGTPLFMAPETLRGEAPDARGDLYSLGAVGYWLLTGRPVFDGDTLVEVCAKHLHVEVVPPSRRALAEIPDALEALVMACLAKDPARRPASAEALASALAAIRVDPWDADAWWSARAPLLSRGAGGAPSGTLSIDIAARVPAP